MLRNGEDAEEVRLPMRRRDKSNLTQSPQKEDRRSSLTEDNAPDGMINSPRYHKTSVFSPPVQTRSEKKEGTLWSQQGSVRAMVGVHISCLVKHGRRGGQR